MKFLLLLHPKIKIQNYLFMKKISYLAVSAIFAVTVMFAACNNQKAEETTETTTEEVTTEEVVADSTNVAVEETTTENAQ
jgi:archaellin